MRKEKLSALMDGELPDDAAFVASLSEDAALHQQWYHYHLARDSMRGVVKSEMLSLDFTQQVAAAISAESIEPALDAQPMPASEAKPKMATLWWQSKNVISRLAQVGLAACVTLAVIGGVQQFSNSSDDNDVKVLNTMPIGISVSPVGGLTQDSYQINEQRLAQQTDQAQYERLRRLLQDYELQKRMNVVH